LGIIYIILICCPWA